MKSCISVIVLLMVCILSRAQDKKVVFVIVDGISADVIEKLNTPAIDSISAEGGFAHASVGGRRDDYTQTPTISAVGYNTVLTGTWVNKHNVWDNDIAAPNYHYKTIFRHLKNHDSSKRIAIFSSWLDNRTKLGGEGMKETNYLQFDEHVDSLEYDTVNYQHDKSRSFMNRIDETVVDSAAASIRNSAPDLTWVYLEYTDDMGHMHGDSPEFHRAVELMDKQMGRLWSAINDRRKKTGEDWLILITTDHGRDSATGKHHGGQSDRERLGWIATNAKNLNSYFKSGGSSIADIMPTIARFMGISIPENDKMEIDGVPLIGEIGASAPEIKLQGNKLNVSWKPASAGEATIWLSTTNHYRTGGTDNYRMMKKVALRQGSAIIDVRKIPSPFYKVVIKTPHNYLNRWLDTKKIITPKN